MVPTDFPGTLQPLGDLNLIFSKDFKHIPSKKSFQEHFSPPQDKFHIARIFKPMLEFMRLAGCLPYQIKNRDGEFSYSFKRCSLISLYSWVSILGAFTFLATNVLNREFGLPWPVHAFRQATDTDGLFKEEQISNKIPSILLTMDRMFQLGIPFFAFLNMFLIRIRSGHMMEFLKKWGSVMDDYHKEFSTYYTINLKDLKKMENISTAFIVVGCAIPFFVGVFAIKPMLIYDNFFINVFFNMGMSGFVSFAFLIVNMLTFCSLHVIKSMYREANIGIEQEYKGMGGLVTYENVKAWIRIVSQLRKQVEGFQRLSGLQELLDLLFTFLTVLCLSYVAFTLYLESIPGAGPMMPFVLGFVAFGLVRTYMKGRLAEQLTEEEQKIGMTVIGMKVTSRNHDPCKTRLEMKTLCDMIFSKPTQVTFGNVIVLNKKLLLSVLSQLASYLVVFLQFKNSNT